MCRLVLKPCNHTFIIDLPCLCGSELCDRQTDRLLSNEKRQASLVSSASLVARELRDHVGKYCAVQPRSRLTRYQFRHKLSLLSLTLAFVKSGFEYLRKME